MKRNFLIGIVISMIIGMFTGCKDDKDEPKVEIDPVIKQLVDKQDSIFLDNGKYVAATTKFTKDSAELVLKSKIWRKAKWYVYDTYNIVSFIRNINICYKFCDDNKYQLLLDAPTQEKMDFQIETSPFVNYEIEGKTLMFEDAPLVPYTIVAVDKDRVVLDRLCNNGDWTVSNNFPTGFDTKKSKVRCVLTPWSSN